VHERAAEASVACTPPHDCPITAIVDVSRRRQ